MKNKTTLIKLKTVLYLLLECILIVSCKNNPEPYTVAQLSQIQRNVSPQFIPNSEDILYINDASGNLELWQLSKSGKPKQITYLKQKISDLQVAPDGSFAVFSVDTGGDEKYDMYKYDIKSGQIINLTNTPKMAEKGYSIAADGTKIAMEIDSEIPFRPQIFIYDIKTSKFEQINKSNLIVRFPIWSKNGKKIAARITSDDQSGKLLLFDLENKKTDTIKPDDKNNIFSPITFSPDDKNILCLTKNDKGFDQLTLIDATTYDVKGFGPGDWDVMEAVWHKNSGIYFTKNVSGQIGVYHLQNPHSKVEEILPPSGNISGININKEETKLLFSKQDATHPEEIYLLDLKTKQLQQLTHSIPSDIEPSKLSKAEPFKIQSFDNTPIQGFLYKPNVKSEKLLPAVVFIHGGPSGQDKDNFDTMTQSLTQAGFVVFNINYRGSVGYGKVFEDMNNRDWGGGDLKDIRAVLEHYIKQGLIDKNKIGVTGGSYGGYMTYIAVTKDPDLFAAAAPGFGMVDLIADYNLGKDRFSLWYEGEMGNPTTDSLLFVDRSPINFINQIKVPLLVFQGANDNNVPKWSSDMIVDSLKANHKPVEYIVYANEGHGFRRRANRIDWIQKTIDFFKQNLMESK